MENEIKKSNEFKGVNPDGSFIRGSLSSLDEMNFTGTFLLIIRDIYNIGLPNGFSTEKSIDCIEAKLTVVTCKVNSNLLDDYSVGQILTLADPDNKILSTYTRLWVENDNGGVWLPWQLQLAGDVGVVAPSNELSAKISQLAVELSKEKTKLGEIETNVETLARDNVTYKDYAVITGGTPVMNTSDATFKIPICFISAREKGSVRIDEEVTVNRGDSEWSTEYIVFDFSTKSAKCVRSNVALSLNESEVVVALVRWGNGVIEGNFLTYILDGKTIEFKPVTSISALKNDLKDSIAAIENKVDNNFSDYAIISGGNPSMNTTDKTFTIPKAYISAAGKGAHLLSNSITITQTDTSWSIQYIIVDIVEESARTVNSKDTLTLSPNEVVVALVRWGNGVIEGNFLKYILNGKSIEFKPVISVTDISTKIDDEITRAKAAEQANADAIAAITGSTSPRMYNPVLNLKKDNLRILDIGNSYTNDAIHYISNIAEAAGVTTGYSLYKTTRSGASFKHWVDTYYDRDTSNNVVSQLAGDALAEVTSGTGEAGDGSLFRGALQNGKWDLILIHQVSTYATDFDSWNGNTDAGYLKEFIQIIRESNPQATIGFYLVHSYRSSYSGNKEKSSLERWHNIAEATKKMCSNYGIDFVIPYGTAVQNLRETSLNDESEFSTDGTHLADGLADYVAACCYWQSVFAPRTGISILGNTFRITNLDESVAGVKNVTDETAPIAQKAAMWAAYNWYEVINPE